MTDKPMTNEDLVAALLDEMKWFAQGTEHYRYLALVAERIGQQARPTLREELAALCHEQWSGWMGYMAGRMGFCSDADESARLITTDDYARWMRQRRTPYAELPEEEKESDRIEADRIIALLND